MAAASLSIDQAFEVREEAGRIVIKPVRAPTSDPAALLDAMHSNTFPEKFDFEPPVGAEMW
jgi:antitoxin MazE